MDNGRVHIYNWSQLPDVGPWDSLSWNEARSWAVRAEWEDENGALQDEHNTARIADIGLSEILAGHDVKASPGTILWASPEQLQVKLV